MIAPIRRGAPRRGPANGWRSPEERDKLELHGSGMRGNVAQMIISGDPETVYATNVCLRR
jgi:hypothetical protein